MKVDGGCHCGEIRYEAEVDPDRVVLCHCTDCQRLSGSAFRVVVQSLPGTLRLIRGSPRVYVKQGESGARREQVFCPTCGTQLYSAPVGDGPKAVGLRAGTITQRAQLRPRAQFWFRSAQPWVLDLKDIPRQDTQPRFAPDGAFGR